MKIYIVLDCNYLCHRAQHTTGHLTHGDEATGVAYGFMKTMDILRKHFDSNRFIFCWDHGVSKRVRIDDQYKANRTKETYTEEETWLHVEFRKQMDQLRTELIPELGYNNNFWAKGYEADDLIAEIVGRTPKDAMSVIVSSDADLYQLLNGTRVVYYRINKSMLYTQKDFQAEWALDPTQWADIKAIVGCKSDNVQGIDRIGEKTAAKYLRGELRPQSDAFIRITKGASVWTHNLPLVTLPLPGTPRKKIIRDNATDENWNAVCKRLGFVSMTTRKKGRWE